MPLTGLAPEGYMPRIADSQIEKYLSVFGAVEVAGTKWCGKTWTSLAHGESISYIDDDFDIAKADPFLITLGSQPHVIDEWQLVPSIRDVVRRRIDQKRGVRGGWILTGSSSPIDQKREDAPKHSGAGRIGRVRMYPMSLAESGDSACTVSLGGIFEGHFAPGMLGDDSKNATALAELACRGGWPEAVGMDCTSAQLIAKEYLKALLEEAEKRGLRGDTVSRLLSSISRTLGQAATQKTLIEDVTGKRQNALSSYQKTTLGEQLAFLKSIYLLEEIPGWVPPSRSPKRLSIKPKRYLADPSLAIAQLGMGVGALLKDWQTFGLVFENLCIRDILVYASALPNVGVEPVRYYRDDSGLETDVIIELADGRWAAIEIKVSEDKIAEGVENLRRLRKKLCENPRAKTNPPEFMAVVVGLSAYAREVDEGIYVIPIRSLCP